MSQSLKIAIAGLGTVGCGVVRLLQHNAALLSARAGRDIEIVAVSARDRARDRGVDLADYSWYGDPQAMAADDTVDVVVELIGGSEGAAYDLVVAAIRAGKHVVTANKALLAHRGLELAAMAEEHGVALMYEAAIAGGIPIVKALREGMAGNHIASIAGILNGTCNYILTEMEATGAAFDDILKQAQDLGYAEADPTFDVDGIDAAHKLCLLSALAFGTQPRLDQVSMSGIRAITAEDVENARELGYVIKLLGNADMLGDHGVAQSVEPCLVPQSKPIASVSGAMNAVAFTGDFVETGQLEGPGAGAGPTASAVISDIADIARGTTLPVFGIPADQLDDPAPPDPATRRGRYYIRLRAIDKPGVLADIAGILRAQDVSVETFIQRGRDPEQPVTLVLTTHECAFGHVEKARDAIADLDIVLDSPHVMRILD